MAAATLLVLVLGQGVGSVQGAECEPVTNVTWVDGGPVAVEVRSAKFETAPGLVAGLVYNGK